MIRTETPRWIRACLVVPCLMATLTFGMVGCGGGTDDASTGTGDTSTDNGGTEDGTGTTTE